jgi:hypothetical protein
VLNEISPLNNDDLACIERLTALRIVKPDMRQHVMGEARYEDYCDKTAVLHLV